MIRESCTASSKTFKAWYIHEGLSGVSAISKVQNELYKFTMPTNDVTVEAICEGDPDPDPQTKWEIHYDKNATAATGTMSNQVVTSEPTTLNANQFAYTGYTFQGWACSKTATTADFTDKQGNITQSALEAKKCVKTPGSGETNPPTNDYYTLYAIWKKDDTPTPDPEYVQDVTPEMCDAMAVLEDKTLPDRRDNKQYTYRKYADGRCWMLSDLAYQPANDVKLTAIDTDISSDQSQTFSALGGKWIEKNGQILYNYKAATAGAWNNQAANTIIADSLCPASWKIPDAWNSVENKYGNTSGEFWRLTLYNFGQKNGGGDKSSQGDDGWKWLQAFTFANDNDSITYRGATYSNLHGPHFTYNGAWDFSASDWATIGGTKGTAGTYGSYFLNTITNDGSVTKPAAFNPQKNGPDYWDINVTVPEHGSSVRCVLRTKSQRADMGGDRAAPGPDLGDITKAD